MNIIQQLILVSTLVPRLLLMVPKFHCSVFTLYRFPIHNLFKQRKENDLLIITIISQVKRNTILF